MKTTGEMTPRALAWLEDRGLDIELASKLGLESRIGAGGECLVYPFIRKGVAVGRKFRRLDRREDQGRFFREKGDTICAYNEDCLRDDSLLELPLIITEGQDDCIAALQAGFPRTISVPDGAPESPVSDLESSAKYVWIDDIRDLLNMKRVPVVILAVDGDSAGAALLHDLSIKLGKSRCKFVTYPLSKDKTARLKDLNDVLRSYGKAGVHAVISRAQFIKVDGVYSMSQLPPMPDSTIYEIGFEALGEHLKIRAGDLSVWTGVPSHGKTTMLNDILCRIVSRYGIRVAWASFEQDPQRDHKRALRSWFCEDYEPKLTHEQRWAADTWIDQQFRFLVPLDDEDPTLEWLISKFEVAAIQHECKVVVADPWNEATHERLPGESETDYTNRALRTLKRFAKAFQVHVAVVCHPTKLSRLETGTYPVPSLYDCAGSAAWYNKPDQGIIVHRMDEEVSIVKVQKSRFHEILGRPGIVKFHYSKQTRRFTEIERNVVDLDEGRRRKRS